MGNAFGLSIDAAVKHPAGVCAAEFNRAPIAGSSFHYDRHGFSG